MEDPDLICRVSSPASGNITMSNMQATEMASKDVTRSSVTRYKALEEPCNDVLKDQLKILSNFSGTEDPYALLRELHILPVHAKNGSNSDIDATRYNSSSDRKVEDMINCFQGKDS